MCKKNYQRLKETMEKRKKRNGRTTLRMKYKGKIYKETNRKTSYKKDKRKRRNMEEQK